MFSLFLSLGSNLGDRRAHLRAGLRQLHLSLGAPLAVSGVYETAAWGRTDQPDYLNLVTRYESDAPPLRLLRTCQKIEAVAGRVRAERWGSRTLDIDLLCYGPYDLATPTLTVPHPRLHLRNFVLAPLVEIAPQLTLPGDRRTVAARYAVSTDACPVRRVVDLGPY